MPKLERVATDLLRVPLYLATTWRRLTRPTYLSDDTFDVYYDRIWDEAAAAVGATVTRLPDGFRVIGLNGRSTTVKNHLVMLDHHVTVQMTRNKLLMNRLLAERGLPVPEYLAFRYNELAPAADFLRRAGRPCVVKPAYGMAGGAGLTTNVRTAAQLRSASLYGSLSSKTLLIEHQVPGDSYRLLFLDGDLLDVVRRRHPAVIGDGRSTIRELIDRENERRKRAMGADALTRITMDRDCVLTLRADGRSLRSVPTEGERVRVKTASNQNSKQENETIRSGVSPKLVEECRAAAAVAGVRLAGVDIITTDHTRALAESGGVVNEVNSIPGLHFHYQTANASDRVAVAVPVLRRLLSEPMRV